MEPSNKPLRLPKPRAPSGGPRLVANAERLGKARAKGRRLALTLRACDSGGEVCCTPVGIDAKNQEGHAGPSNVTARRVIGRVIRA
jgi:hypothetical protein